jgi:hypothetical protein
MSGVARILAAILAAAAGLGGLWLLAGLAASPALSAQAVLFEASCASREAVERAIVRRIGSGGQGLVGLADGNDGAAARVDVAPDGRWVFSVLNPDGTACIVGSGEDMAPARPLTTTREEPS